MARADILISLVKSALHDDSVSFRKSLEILISEERSKKHSILADRLTSLLNDSPRRTNQHTPFIQNGTRDLVFEVKPQRCLNDLVLNPNLLETCNDLVEEHHRSDLLKSYGLAPRNRVLFSGPPGNGKTSLAEAIAYELMYPLLVVRYDNLIGSYLGETASRLQKVFEVARTRNCVLFFDEFETLGKERGDTKETGEIKRVVSSLLLQIDKLPSHTIVITASNHPELLDRAVWRRFQISVELPNPTKAERVTFIEKFEKNTGFSFQRSIPGIADKLKDSSFSGIEDFCVDVLRKSILHGKQDNPKSVITRCLKDWSQKYTV